MTRISAPSRVALAMAALLASLSLVAWRQSRALESLAELDRLNRAASLAEAEQLELVRTIEFLESRARVVPAARERLGMHTPETAELVLLTGVGR